MSEPSKRLSVSIPAALNKQLEQVAAATYQKPTDVVRAAIRHTVRERGPVQQREVSDGRR
jgi:metal-responsive CopG/Arc/MetJ family transcriptional regulator